MINLPYVSMPERFCRLFSINIQNTIQSNHHLEMYLNEEKDLSILVKKIFRDIEPDGLLGRIISIAGWTGIRNRLSALYIEHALNGRFLDNVNVNHVNEIVNLENKLRYFTYQGNSRIYLLGLYAKLSSIRINQIQETHYYSPLQISDEIIELMKYSKGKSIHIDWLILILVLFEKVLGLERLSSLLKNEVDFVAIMTMLKDEEKYWFFENLLSYGASINDYEFYLKLSES